MKAKADKDGAHGKGGRNGSNGNGKAAAKGRRALVALRRTRVITVSLSTDTVTAVDAAAAKEGRNRSNFVDWVLRRHCGKEAA